MIDDLKHCLETLRTGGVILYPTDTVWGLGCDATNEEAVRKIFDIKRRSDAKALLALLDSEAKLQTYVTEIPDMAWNLIELSERPLTIIYPAARNVAKSLLAEDGSLGIRITHEEFSKMLCMRFKKPIVSTSANMSGESSPQNFAQISEEIKPAVDYIVKFRQNDTQKATPSSIIKLDKGNVIQIIRN